MKKKANIFIGLIIIVGFCFMYLSYSRYNTRASGNLESSSIAKWIVKLNDENISQNSTFTQNVKFNLIPNQYVASNQIAPGSEGYIDLELDTTGAGVAVLYNIEVDKYIYNFLEEYEYRGEKYYENYSEDIGFEIVGYEKNDDITENPTCIPKENYYVIPYGGIKNCILLTDSRKVKYRIYVRWNNEDVINEIQSLFANRVEEISLPIKVSVEQYLGGMDFYETKRENITRRINNGDIGKYVDLGTNILTEEQKLKRLYDWRVLYVDNNINTTYLILSDFLPTSKMPNCEGIVKDSNYCVWSSENRDVLLSYFNNNYNLYDLVSGIEGAMVYGAASESLIMKSYTYRYKLNSWGSFDIATDLYVTYPNFPENNCFGFFLNDKSDEYESELKMFFCRNSIGSGSAISRECGIRPIVAIPSNVELNLIDGIFEKIYSESDFGPW